MYYFDSGLRTAVNHVDDIGKIKTRKDTGFLLKRNFFFLAWEIYFKSIRNVVFTANVDTK